MGVFNDRLELWSGRNNLALTRQPVLTAPVAGLRRTEENAPEDNYEVPNKDKPRVFCKEIEFFARGHFA